MPLWSVALAVTLANSVVRPVPANDVETSFQSIQRAVESGDVKTLRRLVDPRFEMLHGLGQLDKRDAWLALVRKGNLPRQTQERREYARVITVAGTVAIRQSIVRLRDSKTKHDMWMRSSMVFIKERGLWRQLRQQSTMLSDSPSADVARLDDYLGTYRIPGRDGFDIVSRDGLLILRWANGAELPLVPHGPDTFGSGMTSSVAFGRDQSGKIVSATRSGPDGPWWTATPVR